MKTRMLRWMAGMVLALSSQFVVGMGSPSLLPAQGSGPLDTAAVRAMFHSEIAGARAAEAAGNRREALRLYSQAHWRQAILSEAQMDTLLATIFRVAAALKPRPAVPDSALFHEVRAQVMFDSAKTKADLDEAAFEFYKAIIEAPWVARFYYNMALLAERSGEVSIAARMLRRYLLSPEIDDREAARRKLIALQYNLERQMARYSAVDGLLGDWASYSKKKGDQRASAFNLLFGPCGLAPAHCAALGKPGVAPDPAWMWDSSGTASLTRKQDTLFVGRSATWFGVMRGSNVDDIAWFYRKDEPESRNCGGYDPSGIYPIHGALTTATDGSHELQLNVVMSRPAGYGSPTCEMVETSNYMLALRRR